MNYKSLFYFEVSKILIAILNIIFLVKQYPKLSFIISILSIVSSVAGAVVGGVAVAVAGAGAVAGGVAVAVAVAGAVVGAVAVAVAVAVVVAGATVEEKEEIKPKKIKRYFKCKQEIL